MDCVYACVGVGRCFWEKASNGCKNSDDSDANTWKYHAYDFYALCRSGFRPHAEFQCSEDPAKIVAGTCQANPDYRLSTITGTQYCVNCENSMCANVV